MTDCILSLFIEHDWPLDAVPLDDCAALAHEQFSDFSTRVVRHCVRSLSTAAAAPWQEWQQALDASHLALDPAAVCRFRASTLLTQIESWPEADFMEAWQDGVPRQVTPDPRHLEGLGVTIGDQIQSLPLDSLPQAPAARFAALFFAKRYWSLAELVPYVDEFVSPGAKHEKLILVYARAALGADKQTRYIQRFPEGAPTYVHPYAS